MTEAKQHWCQTCGNETQGPDQMCICWCLLADALQQYLGMDHDGSADMAARLWRQEADRPRVWSAEWAATRVDPPTTYPDTRFYAPADVREQDHRDYPHDDPCPRCGRLQWGLSASTVDPMNPTDTEQETCGGCGYTLTDAD
jgi:hypothetical protein